MYRNIIISFVILFTALSEGMAQTHVQTTSKYQVSTTKNISLSLPSASTSKNLIVVHLDWDGQTRTVSSVADNNGNNYIRINGPTNWNGTSYRAELWYAYNIKGGATTITATLSGAPTSFFQIYISEYSGIISVADPLDQNSVAIGNKAAVSSGAVTTKYNNELVYGASIGASGNLLTGAGFTNRSTANSNIIEDRKAVAVGSYNATFTSAGGNWIAQTATFITTSSLITLPVELISFTGQCNNNRISLEWATASEANNDYFAIERSEDGINWKAIGTVKGAGNSSSIQKYSFIADPEDGEISYFRLRQTDTDGNFKYFNILQVNNCHNTLTGVNIYPNPSNGSTLNCRMNLKANEAYSIEVFNSLGKMISRSQSTQPEFTMSFPFNLPSGVYFARFSSAGVSTTKCFLVSH